MNKTDVVVKVAEKSGVEAVVCERLIKAIEEQSGEALLGKFRGAKNNRADMLEGLVRRTEFETEVCEKVLGAFEEVFDKGLSEKFRIFK